MNSTVKEVIEWIICIVVAIVLAILIRYFIGTPTEVKMTSMSPTLRPGERLILNKIPITFGQELKRGDIITFERPSKLTGVESVKAEYNYKPENIFSSFIYYVLEIGKDSYIKRLIGLPGDHVQIQSDGVYINEQKLEESYIPNGVMTYPKNEYLTDFVVPEGYIFAMGDNRENSTDCREFGCVPIEKVEGVAWIRIWPLNLFGEIH